MSPISRPRILRAPLLVEKGRGKRLDGFEIFALIDISHV
jgi:hypothetical protein